MFRKSKNDNTVYKIGLYYRLSREDGDDLESESIANQRDLLHKYLRDNNLIEVDEYVDDGYSGGNFNRPGFKKLIRDVEDKKINCIITKDLSRLGRDHIDTGRYVERYFPENNVRYIALNDDIDTFYESSGSDMMPFRLSMNDMYAKDISKKVRSSLMAMKQKGKFCGSSPCYGYMRDPKDRGHLIPNPQTSPIVKRIFDLYKLGHGRSVIADILTREQIPTPLIYKNTRRKGNLHPEIWSPATINNILKNPVYTGCLIQHKSQTLSYKSKKRRKISKSEWCIVNGTHDALIDKEDFDYVQSLRNNHNYYAEDKRNVDYTLSGIVYCKDCGARMTINYDKNRDRIIMNCNNYRKYSKYGMCFSHYINYRKLETTIYSKIKELSYAYMSAKEEFEEILTQEYINPSDELNRKIKEVEKEIDRLHKKQDSLYDDKFNGVIDIDLYKRLYDNTCKDIDRLNNKISNWNLELDSLNEDKVKYNENMEVVEKFLKIDHPTKEMIYKIIDKIYVTKDKDIEIYYKIKKPQC